MTRPLPAKIGFIEVGTGHGTLKATIQKRIGTRQKKIWLHQHRGKTSTHAPGWAFPVSFSGTLSSQIKVSRALSASFCVQLVVRLFCFHAARVFDYFVVIEIAFMDNQAQITETISRLDSEKVSW